MNPPAAGYPENPVVCRVMRDGHVESVHRGAWCLVDSSGQVLEGAGSLEAPYWARSAIKSFQALPLFETGAAERFGYAEDEVALALASHSGEPCHTERVGSLLERLGLPVGALACGVHPPNDSATRFALRQGGERATELHNNCSGKHAGFLALALHLGVDPADYLDPESASQLAVRAAIAEISGTPLERLRPGIDGCSAPTYRLSLRDLATGFARVTNPDGLGAERAGWFRRMTAAAGRYPELVAGNRKRIDTDLLRASGGRLFAKIGAEAVHAIGVVGGDRALALKIDDGGLRGLHCLALGLLEAFDLASAAELEALAAWSEPLLRNHAGLVVGRIEPVLA